jgi:hypothetical protein
VVGDRFNFYQELASTERESHGQHTPLDAVLVNVFRVVSANARSSARFPLLTPTWRSWTSGTKRSADALLCPDR